MSNHRTTTERGSILVYTMLTMASMLAIGLTLNALFISKFRLAAGARNATVALYAADSAVELCLYEARTLNDDALVLGNGASFKIIDAAPGNADVTDDCTVLGSLPGSASVPFGFQATGTFRGTTRALEISQ